MSEVVTAIASATGGIDDAEQQRREKVATFMSIARDRFHTVSTTENPLRQLQLDDKTFAASEQWTPEAVADRLADDRPRMTFNRIRQFLRQVTNQLRQANLAIKVLPVDDAADIETAEVFQGIIRHIEDKSDAAVAYSTAGDDQVTVGRGYWRIDAEYSDDRSFTQDLKIRRIRNCFSVYMDPSHVEIDGSDANYCFVIEDISKDEFTARFGKDAAVSLTDFASVGDQAPDWMPTGRIRIAEYWYVEMFKETIVAIRWNNGDEEVVTAAEADKLEAAIARLPEPRISFERRASRQVDARRVKMALINGVGIIEGNEDKTEGKAWPGKWIPIIPCIGDEIDLNGKVDLRGMVRDAKDPQRLLNWEKTMLAEALALAPLTQWVGYEGQFSGHERAWKLANRRRAPYLQVKAFTLDGQVAPLPQRITSEPPITNIVQAIAQDENDLQAIMGLYQESLGKRSSTSQSGKAITALQQQGELANSNFLDNMSRAIRCTGRYLVDLIPHFYDVPRVVRILGADENPKTVMVHAAAENVPQMPPPGIDGIYDLSAGKYDVSISVGPSMPTKRKEALEALNQFVQVYPEAFPILGDLIVKNMDWPGSDAAAARLKKAVPPQFLDQEQDGGAPPIPPEVQQQMAAMQQLLQQTQAELQEAQSGLAAKKLEADSRERIEAGRRQLEGAKIASAEKMAEEKLAVQVELATMQAKVSRLERLLEQIHDMRVLAVEHAHDVDRGATDREHQVGMAAQDRAAAALQKTE